MTGKELLQTLLPVLNNVGINDKNWDMYKEIQQSLEEYQITDSFYQLKKNDKGEGLALEIFLFNEATMHDIVVTKKEMEHTVFLTKYVKRLVLSTSYEELNDKGENVIEDKLELSITSEETTFIYVSDSKRLKEFSRIKNNLLKILNK